MRGRTDLIDALTKYFEGHIAKHKVNIDNLNDLSNSIPVRLSKVVKANNERLRAQP